MAPVITVEGKPYQLIIPGDIVIKDEKMYVGDETTAEIVEKYLTNVPYSIESDTIGNLFVAEERKLHKTQYLKQLKGQKPAVKVL